MNKKKVQVFTEKEFGPFLEPANESDKASKITDIFLVTLIFFNILMVILETVDSLYTNYKTFLDTLNIFQLLFFQLNI